MGQRIYEFDFLSRNVFPPPLSTARYQPYESVIWGIETLHFTTPEHPTSISSLGTTFGPCSGFTALGFSSEIKNI